MPTMSPGPDRRYATYDEKCHDLAALFLGDEPDKHTPENIAELAGLIQQTIEDYIACCETCVQAKTGHGGKQYLPWVCVDCGEEFLVLHTNGKPPSDTRCDNCGSDVTALMEDDWAKPSDTEKT